MRAVIGTVFIGIVLLTFGACSAPVIAPPTVSVGKIVQIDTLDVSFAPPTRFAHPKAAVWTLDANGSRHAMLWIRREKMPEDGVEAFVEKAAQQVGLRGMAGVTRREKFMLGDLEAFFVEAVTVVGNQRSAAMQVMVGAEDGLYIVSLMATVETMRHNHRTFEAVVKSLRIPAR